MASCVVCENFGKRVDGDVTPGSACSIDCAMECDDWTGFLRSHLHHLVVAYV